MAKYKGLREELDTVLGTEAGQVGARGREASPVTADVERIIGAAKLVERKKIKPMPDPEAGKSMRRREAARKRKTRGGRASTILSEGKDTLG